MKEDIEKILEQSYIRWDDHDRESYPEKRAIFDDDKAVELLLEYFQDMLLKASKDPALLDAEAKLKELGY